MAFWEPQAIYDAAESRQLFRWLFLLVPAASCWFVPTLLFSVLLGEWGSNPIWGSYFGLGWCLAAFWSGGIFRDHFSGIIGSVWGWAALLPLYFGANWLWGRLDPRGRIVAVRLLWFSGLIVLPGRATLYLDQLGIHLPDYMSHLATSF